MELGWNVSSNIITIGIDNKAFFTRKSRVRVDNQPNMYYDHLDTITGWRQYHDLPDFPANVNMFQIFTPNMARERMAFLLVNHHRLSEAVENAYLNVKHNIINQQLSKSLMDYPDTPLDAEVAPLRVEFLEPLFDLVTSKDRDVLNILNHIQNTYLGKIKNVIV